MMDKATRQEAKLRTVELESYEQSKAALDALEQRLIRLYKQTHETVNGKRIKLTKRRKIAKANKLIDTLLSDDLDVSQDAINQLKVLDV